MDDFLYVLKLQLQGRLSDEEIDHQMEVYENYIQEQMAGGKTLEQVMRKLGDPVKIADLIVERQKQKKLEEKYQDRDAGKLTAKELNDAIINPERGITARFVENEGWDVRLGKLKLNSWYGTLIILCAVLAIFSVLSYFFPQLRH